MSNKAETLPEAGSEAEVIETGVVVKQDGLNDKFQAIIELADQVDRVGAALDKVRRFVLARALPGDWIKFGDKLELGGPGAERVAAAIGISFTGWKDWKESGTDKNGNWYTWYYSAEASLGGRSIERVEGRASSRDKFFGYESGAWKELADVKEADVRTAARRGVLKEGTKLLLGIRGIPVEAAESLGLDPKKIKEVEFGKRGESKVTAPAAGTVVTIKDIKGFNGKNKATGKTYVRYTITDSTGAQYSTFDEKIAMSAEKFKALGSGVIIAWEINQNPRFGNDLKSIKEVPKTTSPDGDAQEDHQQEPA